jgi:hypothetical protein
MRRKVAAAGAPGCPRARLGDHPLAALFECVLEILATQVAGKFV